MKRDLDLRTVGVRAIDIGYFNVKLTHGRKETGDSNLIRTEMFPALAPVLTGDSFSLARSTQKMAGCVVDVGGVLYYVGADANLHTRGVEPRDVSDDYCTSAKYLALLRGALHRMCDVEKIPLPGDLVVERLVVGLPLNTFAKHNEPLLQLVKGEHFVGAPGEIGRTVRVRDAHVVPQPRGALFDFGLASRGALDGWTLVLDVGGGTLDYLVGTSRETNYSRSGAYPKAMLACAQAVVDEIDPGLRDNLGVMGRIDQAIRECSPTFRISGIDYELAPFQPKIDAVLEEGLSKMMARVGGIADIDQVLCTGGGAKVVHRYLANTRPELIRMMRLDPTPVFANVRGFQIYGELAHNRSRARERDSV